MTCILITGARAPAALHLARLMHDAGYQVVMSDSVRWPVSAVSRCVNGYTRVPVANGDPDAYANAINAVVRRHDVSRIIPTCEEVFALARMQDAGRLICPVFAPNLVLLTQVHSKIGFVELAQQIGLAVPDTTQLTTAEDVAAFTGDPRAHVFKPVWSRFATSVQIKPKRPDFTPTPEAPWVAQRFIAGSEVCVYGIAQMGRLLGWAAYTPVYRAGQGASIAFQPIRASRIGEYMARFVAATDWTGQIALDLILQDDGTPVGIECNPRATSGIHLFRDPKGFTGAIMDGAEVTPDVTGLQAVKLALAAYGPWSRPVQLWNDMRCAQDVMGWPDDPRPMRRQLLSTLEFTGIALRHRIGLTAATTHDIAWNGP
ncbi:MAG: ATP-grasp domain-containing protein [Pseudomonadota bacterium]